MSGHSKWAGIKHKKAANDAQRGNIFTKLANNITVASKQGGGDPSLNASLRMAIDKARSANMPKDNIERAIKRGTAELGGAAVEELLYEGFGPGNVAILVEVLTDNRNRSNSDIRLIFSKNGGRIADGGGVAYQFTQKGVLRLENLAPGELNRLEESVIESGADDYLLGENYATVFVGSVNLHKVGAQLETAGFKIESAKIEWVANSPIEVGDEVLEKVARLLDSLEENDDVVEVYTNLEE
jgi:YebC/PmpR family DNA-binding regulatory protein